MGLFDAVIDIGKSVIGSAMGGGGGGGNTVIAPQYGNSLIKPLDGASGKNYHSDKRTDEKTKKALTVKEKAQGASKRPPGDDSLELAKEWNQFLKEASIK